MTEAQFKTMHQVDVWLAEKIKAELSDKPDPDWGGCMGMFFGAKDDFPMSRNKAEELFKEAVEYGEHVIETYKIE